MIKKNKFPYFNENLGGELFISYDSSVVVGSTYSVTWSVIC